LPGGEGANFRYPSAQIESLLQPRTRDIAQEPDRVEKIGLACCIRAHNEGAALQCGIHLAKIAPVLEPQAGDEHVFPRPQPSPLK